MDFFKKLFYFKRTKMIDEAVFFHRPVNLGKNILSYIITLIVASLIVAVSQSIPLIFYLSSKPGVMDSIANGSTSALADAIKNMPPWLTGIDLLFTGLFILVAIYYCKKYENRGPFTMGFVKRGCAAEYLFGFLVGGAIIGLTLLLNLAAGTVEFSFVGFSPIMLLFLAGFVIKGFGECAFVHGFFTVSVARDYAPIVAILAGTCAYLAFSIGSATVTVVSFFNILLIGFLTGVYVFKRGSIIGASAILAGWNFMQLSVFAPNSDTSPLVLAKATGSAYINGSYGGVGGGLFATLVLVVAIFLLLLTPQKRSSVSDFEENAYQV